MGKRSNPMAVKSALTYEIAEAAQILNKTPATIRNWIKDGLPVMSSRKPYLLSGEAIREYLRIKYRTAKSQLADDQLYCLSCRSGRIPIENSVHCSLLNPKTALLKGACHHCGATSTRMISRSRISDFKQNFRFM